MNIVTFFSMTQQPPVGLLNIEVSRSHSVTSQSVGLLWTSDQPDAETSNGQHTTFTPTSVRFEPAISENQSPQTHVLDRAATRFGNADIILSTANRNLSGLKGRLRQSMLDCPAALHSTNEMLGQTRISSVLTLHSVYTSDT